MESLEWSLFDSTLSQLPASQSIETITGPSNTIKQQLHGRHLGGLGVYRPKDLCF